MAKKESGPEPVDPSVLEESALDAAVDSAEQAFADASDLDALTKVKIDHVGGKAPLALAQRALGGSTR